jgi:alpha-N-arabinofuranosidase
MKNFYSLSTAILIIALMFPACGPQQDEEAAAVPNASFEEAGEVGPALWKSNTWRGEGDFDYAESGRTGSRSVRISSATGADGSWSTIVQVKPFSRYRLSGWIRTEDLSVTNARGALFNLHGIRGAETPAVKGTSDWIRVEMEFDTDFIDAVQINCLFGGWGPATGSAWYDDLALEMLKTRELDPAVTVHADRIRKPISKYIYGQFIEHLGRCIYGGIWAEMLEDRKFYHAPGSEESPWRLLGPAEAMRLDTTDSYVGELTPVFQASGGQGAGLLQGGLGLNAGKAYVGRIVIAGEEGGVPLEVSLIWGLGDEGRSTVRIEDLGRDYRTIPLRFTSGARTDQGRLEIRGLGSGTFRIATVSLMPENNIQGFRPDVLQLLRELDSPVYRWPGGNFVSGYDWTDGIGDPDQRPPRKNPAWRGIEHNDVGLHEFMALCRLLDTEPYIAVNTGLGSVEMTARQVEYCNGAQDTPMGRLRAENGHPEPFGVKWWAVGNEMYGGWQLGHMPLEDYVKKHNRVVTVMRAADPDIQVVGVGSVGEWSRRMLSDCADHMDLISEHFYCQERPGLIAHIFQPLLHVRRIATAHREYRETIPGLEGKDLRIALDEWNFWYGPHVYGELGTRYFLKDALGIAAGLHEYFRQSDIMFMANYAQTVNVIGAIKTTKTECAFATTGLVLKLYRQRFGSLPLEITGAPEPLDTAAAWTEDRSAVTVAIVNPTKTRHTLPVLWEGIHPEKGAECWTITGADPLAYNEPGREQAVTIVEDDFNGNPGKLESPPLSVRLFRFRVH